MLKRIVPILLASAVLLTACGAGAPAVPTMDPASIPLTAAAAAATIVAMTSAAQPTVPPTALPTQTPLPTFTPDPLQFPPTVAFPTLIMPTPTQASSSGDCLKPLDLSAAGPTKNIRVENTLNQSVTLSLNLSNNLFGQCGALVYQVKKNEKFRIQIPNGSWFAYAWTTTGPSNTPQGAFYLGPSKTDDLLRLVIRKDVIGLLGP